MPTTKLTKTAIDALQAPAAGYLIVRDTETRGFGIRITSSGVRSFFVERQVNGRNVRATVGRYGELSLVEARKLAEGMLRAMSEGSDPVQERRAARAAQADRGTSFGEVAIEYINERTRQSGGIKASTADGYRYDLEKYLAPFLHRQIQDISRSEVAKLQQQLSEGGPTAANRAMRFLRAVFNFANWNEDYTDHSGKPLVTSNPVEVLKQRRLWNPKKRKHDYLDASDLGNWMDAVLTLDPYRWCETIARGERRVQAVRGYLLLMVCCGLRSGEATNIKRGDWNARTGVLTIADPKNLNSAGRVFELPVGWRVAHMLNEQAQILDGWLLPNEKGDGPVKDPRAVIADVRERGAHFTPHDLRRTFASVLNALEPSPSQYQIKRLMNHTPDADVTTEYIQHEMETLRAIMQRVEDVVFGAGTAFRPSMSATAR